MKEKMWKAKKLKKLISFLMSFVIIMTSLWINPITIMALNVVDESCTVSNPKFWEDGSLHSLKVSFQATGNYGAAYGKIGIHNGISQKQWGNPAYQDNNGNQTWPSLDSLTNGDATLITISNEEEFLWTDCQKHEVTVTFTKGTVKAGEFYIYLWSRHSTGGFYPDYKYSKALSINGGKLSYGGTEVSDTQVHLHTWDYAVDNMNTTKLVAACTCAKGTDGCAYKESELESDDRKVSLTLNATSKTHTGEAVTASFGDGEAEAWKVAIGSEVPTITYYLGNGEIKTTAENSGAAGEGQAPVNVGKYVAKITVSGATASKEFEIQEPHTHNGVKQDGKAATCTNDGWKDYYACSCGACYEDVACTTEITDLDVWKTTRGKIAAIGHAWNYTASEATLTATCSNNSNHKATLTLTPTNPTYSGDGVTTGWNVGETPAFILAGVAEWKDALGTDAVPVIKYVGTGSTTYAESETAPTAVGTYKATITKETQTAELAFELKNAKPSYSNDEILALAKTNVTSKINELSVSNLTTKKDIENAIKTALLSDDKTKTVGSEIKVTKEAASTETAGQIAINVKLSLNDKDITFDLIKVIDKLEGKNITVTVEDGNDNTVSGATVKVMLGKTQKAEGTSAVDGSCTFSNLPAGLYNIVITKEGVTKTAIADLTTDNATVPVVLDTSSVGSSHLNVKDTIVSETAAKVEETVVRNLDALAEALKETDSAVNSYKVEMAVEAKADTQVSKSTQSEMVKEANKGETAAENKATNIDFLDIVIQKTITKNSVEQKPELITDTGATVMEIIIPFNFTGKTKVKVLREHNGVVEKFNETTTGTDGTCKIDRANGLIILYATKFSTYAVSYVAEGESAIEEPATPPAYTGGGSVSVTVPATGITVETDNVELTKAGETAAIKAAIQPSNATDTKLTFTSSDEKVAKVDANGVITAVGNGTAAITVKTANGITKTITVTVNIPSDENKDDGNKDDSSSEEEEAVTPAKTAANTIAINKGLKVSPTGSKINVSWGKVADAEGYLVYAAYCGTSFGKAVKTIKNPSSVSTTITKLNGKKLDLKKNFKIYVKAYKLVDGKKVAFGKSITAHITGTKNAKNTNVKELKLTSKSKLTLAVGKTSKIKAKAVLVDSAKKQLSDSHTKEFRYASSNKKVAAVDKNGKITAKAKGTCYIYVYARNGYAKKVTVTVK